MSGLEFFKTCFLPTGRRGSSGRDLVPSQHQGQDLRASSRAPSTERPGQLCTRLSEPRQGGRLARARDGIPAAMMPAPGPPTASRGHSSSRGQCLDSLCRKKETDGRCFGVHTAKTREPDPRAVGFHLCSGHRGARLCGRTKPEGVGRSLPASRAVTLG